MPSDELMEAADRIIAISEDERAHAYTSAIVATALPLARHYKSTRDETAIDEAWLYEIGFSRRTNAYDDTEWYVETAWEVMIRRDGIGIWEAFLNGFSLPDPDTRQDVLALLTALGIEVKT